MGQESASTLQEFIFTANTHYSIEQYAVLYAEQHFPTFVGCYTPAWLTPAGEVVAVRSHSDFYMQHGGMYSTCYAEGNVRLAIEIDRLSWSWANPDNESPAPIPPNFDHVRRLAELLDLPLAGDR